MKNFLLILMLLFAFVSESRSQTTPETALQFNSFYKGLKATLTNSSFGPATPGVNYGCISNTGSYAWTFIPVCDSQIVSLNIYPVDTLGMAIYGPFQDTTQILSKLNGLAPIQCSNYFYYTGTGYLPSYGKGIYYIAFSANQSTNPITITGDHLGSYFKYCAFCKNSNFVDQQICLVTLDSATQRNIIILDKGDTTNIAGSIIYRENSIANQFDSLTFISKDSANFYIDMTANPAIRNWQYMVHKLDDCGYSLPPYYQSNSYIWHVNTIHLQQGISTNNSINLSWNNSINNSPVPGNGPFISSFFIYRSNGGPFYIIDSIPYTGSSSYTDVNPAQGLNFYQVAMRQTTSCAITLKPATASAYSESRSNIVSTTFTGLQEPVNHHFFVVYPNPASSDVTIELQQNNGQCMLEIIGVDGRIVYKNNSLSGGKTKINTAEFSKGFYLIKVTSDGKDYYKKLMIN